MSFPYFDVFAEFKIERKQSASSILTCKSFPVSSKSSVLPEKSARLLKNTHVDFIFVDAADKHDRMPLDTVDVDAMKMKGTYFASERFTSEEQFVDFIESNTVFGAFLSKNFFLYTIARQFTGKLKPTSFHKRNFPTDSSMVAICQTRYLVISPNPKDLEEKKAHFSSTRLNGVTSIDIDDEPSSDGENYAKEVDESFLDSKKLKYETDEDEAVKHSTPGNNGVSCSFRKRSFSEDSDSEDPSHYPNDYKTSSYVSSYERDSSAPDSRSRSISNSKSRKMTDDKN